MRNEHLFRFVRSFFFFKLGMVIMEIFRFYCMEEVKFAQMQYVALPLKLMKMENSEKSHHPYY